MWIGAMALIALRSVGTRDPVAFVERGGIGKGMDPSTSGTAVRVAALYRFAAIDAPRSLAEMLRERCLALGMKGTLIVAPEGLNGTVAGAPQAVDALIGFIRSHGPLRDIEAKFSDASEMPFYRMKVRLKREIVTMGVGEVDPAGTAPHVPAAAWNALVGDPDTVVIDTRNDYEVRLGTFRGAINPGTASFREFPAWLEENRDRLEGRRIAMFCTGGIRCEKATAYMRASGFDDVHQLDGGILRYLEEVPAQQSLWQGECFVFDERVSVGHGVGPGKAVLCRACRTPLTPADLASGLYVEGEACPHCHDARSEADRERYRERHRQVRMAETRGRRHIGAQ